MELSVGKTQVIKVIQKYFLKTKNWILTYIANATLFIKGTIIHYLLRFSIDKHININKFNTIINILPNIQFIVIDKISMVGCILLFTIHVKLQKLNSNNLSFERINIMFMRDFLQTIFPINDTPLYSKKYPIDLYIHKINSRKVVGKNLWENYIWSNNVLLTNIWNKKNAFDMLPLKNLFEQKIILTQILIYWKHIFHLI